MSNNKINGLMLAKKQFFEDLKNDVDFIAFKERAKIEYGLSYGTVIAGSKRYLLNIAEPTSESLLSTFKKVLR